MLELRYRQKRKSTKKCLIHVTIPRTIPLITIHFSGVGCFGQGTRFLVYDFFAKLFDQKLYIQFGCSHIKLMAYLCFKSLTNSRYVKRKLLKFTFTKRK